MYKRLAQFPHMQGLWWRIDGGLVDDLMSWELINCALLATPSLLLYFRANLTDATLINRLMLMNQSIANVDSGGRQKPDTGHVTYSNSVRQRNKLRKPMRVQLCEFVRWKRKEWVRSALWHSRKGWTSRAPDPRLNITSHFSSGKWELLSDVLQSSCSLKHTSHAGSHRAVVECALSLLML